MELTNLLRSSLSSPFVVNVIVVIFWNAVVTTVVVSRKPAVRFPRGRSPATCVESDEEAIGDAMLVAMR